ncbi:hypothetical protein EUGRSUZ_J02039 [Eucalyptus grandis]|uniref:Uncharacterized protein n=2 Tax=Eucalyptus grandis TaxID=71139 RepID=A0ACC3J7F8_EUCGR|nr:hypothetical protein EUGRSUZ_J02039 [Eucalyptus grandis]
MLLHLREMLEPLWEQLRESEPLDDDKEQRCEPLLARLPGVLEEVVLAEKLLERANLEDEDEGDDDDVEWPLLHFSFLDGFHISSILSWGQDKDRKLR